MAETSPAPRGGRRPEVGADSSAQSTTSVSISMAIGRDRPGTEAPEAASTKPKAEGPSPSREHCTRVVWGVAPRSDGQATSKRPAAPMPPPTHMVTTA
jgi:hypothetical protein